VARTQQVTANLAELRALEAGASGAIGQADEVLIETGIAHADASDTTDAITGASDNPALADWRQSRG